MRARSAVLPLIELHRFSFQNDVDCGYPWNNFCAMQMDASLSAPTPFKVCANGHYSPSSTPSKELSGKSTSTGQNDHYHHHQHIGRHLWRSLVVFWSCLRSLLAPCSVRCSQARTHWSHVHVPSRHELQRIVVSAVPYLLFLFFYGLNPYTHVLPVASDITRANLRNISAWESFLFQRPVHLVVSSVHHLGLDFLAALPYLAHYFIPVLYPIYLYLIDRLEVIQQFYRLLGFTMWGHYAIWFVLTTLPPWALDFIAASQRHNETALTDAILLAHKEGPAFARIDSFTGLSFFYGMFVGNPVPFGSFPSGHVAWPMCILLTLPANLRGRFSVYIAWVSWATLYTGHHFVLDIFGALALVVVLGRLMGNCSQTQSRCPILPI